jgi:hypothetical protein
MSPLHRAPRCSLLGLALVISTLVSVRTARAEDEQQTLFAKGAAALERGEFGAAIDAFEAFSDRGFVHPDASFDRGIAYVMRVKAHADQPGDLGRAAAAFEETLRMRPDDREADALLDQIRADVTRRRSRRAKDAVDVRPTLDRMLVGLASPETWGMLALLSSILLAVALVLRKRPPGPAHVAGSVLLPTACVGLLVFVPLTSFARELRRSTQPGVVVAPEIHLSGEDGRALPGDAIPEAALVEVGERRGATMHVRWGSIEGWVPAGTVRLLGP